MVSFSSFDGFEQTEERFRQLGRAFGWSDLSSILESSALAAQANALRSFESWLVRRAVCGYPAHDGAGSAFAAYELASPHSEEGRWPGNAEFSAGWLASSQVAPARTTVTRHVLCTLERRLRAGAAADEAQAAADPVSYDELVVEPIMPLQWRANWPLPSTPGVREPQLDIDRLGHEVKRDLNARTFGNLTLLPRSAAGRFAQASAQERATLFARSPLLLNRGLSDLAGWDEAAIARRGDALFAVASEMWSGPPAD